MDEIKDDEIGEIEEDENEIGEGEDVLDKKHDSLEELEEEELDEDDDVPFDDADAM